MWVFWDRSLLKICPGSCKHQDIQECWTIPTETEFPCDALKCLTLWSIIWQNDSINIQESPRSTSAGDSAPCSWGGQACPVLLPSIPHRGLELPQDCPAGQKYKPCLGKAYPPRRGSMLNSLGISCPRLQAPCPSHCRSSPARRCCSSKDCPSPDEALGSFPLDWH